MTFLKLIQWATSGMSQPEWEEELALDFLEKCLELHPLKRLSAEKALDHPFLWGAEEDELADEEVVFA